MSSFGIGTHAHVDAAFLAVLLTFLTYGIKWIFGLNFPAFILQLPTFMVIFCGFYAVLYVVFLVLWSGK
ncbi:MAG TPA: hypothetical protein VMU29_14305 [Smithella sp.]|nr:hypothetical protein [Smithella sp.]